VRIALLGAGIIGTVIARDFSLWDPPDEVTVGDVSPERARAVAEDIGWSAVPVDASDPESLRRFLGEANVVVNAAQYHVNLPVMEAALETVTHYLDLGGLFHTTRRQLELDDRFRDAGLTALLGIGSCPGVSNVHAGDLGSRLDTVQSLIVYNGATVDSSDSLRWPYSLWTIFDEITERPVVFRDGAFSEVEPLSEEELFPFKEPIGYAKAHLSLHSEVATIPLSLASKGIRDCEFRIRHFGFSEGALRKLQFLASIGLASKEPRADGVVPRRLLVEMLEELDPAPPQHPGFKDIATVAVGVVGGSPVRLRLDTTAWPSDQLKVGGGTVVVASPAAIVARWLGSGRLAAAGVHPPETVIPPSDFYAELALRGPETTITEERVLA